MKVLVKVGVLVFIVAMSGPVPAQKAKSAARSPQDLLRGALEIAKTDDLTDAGLLGRKLGLRYVAAPEKNYPGDGSWAATVVHLRLQSHDNAVFNPNRGPAYYDIYQPAGKSYKRVDFEIGLAAGKMCITENDFLAVFGSTAKRRYATDNGGFGYIYRVEQKNQISVSGFFGHRKCMQDLSMSQNMDR